MPSNKRGYARAQNSTTNMFWLHVKQRQGKQRGKQRWNIFVERSSTVHSLLFFRLCTMTELKVNIFKAKNRIRTSKNNFVPLHNHSSWRLFKELALHNLWDSVISPCYCYFTVVLFLCLSLFVRSTLFDRQNYPVSSLFITMLFTAIQKDVFIGYPNSVVCRWSHSTTSLISVGTIQTNLL